MHVTAIGKEVALPLVLTYCKRWRLRVDNLDAVENILWFGAWTDNTLRAVMGLVEIPELPNALLVYGMFSDDSIASYRATYALLKCLHDLPQDLYGTLHLANARAQRALGKFSWLAHKLPDNVRAAITRKAVA